MATYITICKIESQWEFAVWFRELRLGLCDNIERWDEEEAWVYLWLILVDVWLKTTKFCKANRVQLKRIKWQKEKKIACPLCSLAWCLCGMDSMSYSQVVCHPGWVQSGRSPSKKKWWKREGKQSWVVNPLLPFLRDLVGLIVFLRREVPFFSGPLTVQSPLLHDPGNCSLPLSPSHSEPQFLNSHLGK